MLQQIDESILYFLNGLHNTYFDAFFWCGTNAWSYLPLYLVVIWLLYKQYGNKIWLPVLFVILTVVLTDQTINIIKGSVQRLRPTHNPDVAPFIHTVNGYRGGFYSFPSGHAGNIFGMAVFLYRIIAPKRWPLTVALFAWAAIMAYSRIYLGVHYPGDILVGTILGVAIGFFTSWLMMRVYRKIVREKSHKVS